ncbi:MAG: ParB/RepB/Spo0J family partition protein [Candidatus Brocadiia bacterium]
MPPKGAVAATERELTAMERLLHLSRESAEKPAHGPAGDIRHLPLEALEPNPDQPRRAFDDATVDELADSIRARGLIQPLLVRPHPEGGERFQIVVGERRFMAAGRAQLPTVPCIVRKLDDRETYVLSIAENVAREDLNPIDEAAAYRRMLDQEYAANQGEIAQLVGVHRTRVSRKLKLLELDPRVQDHVRHHPQDASLTHLEELSRLPAGDEQYRLFLDAVQGGLSTRELHARIEARLAPSPDHHTGVSKSVIPLEGGARIVVYPTKYTLRVPREAGDQVDLPRIVGDLEGVVAELKSRL